MSLALRVAFIVLMLGLTALFAGLGAWQMSRLAEKEMLIAAVAKNTSALASPLPPASEWGNPTSYFIDPATGQRLPFGLDYRSVTFSGSYHSSGQVLVFTSLADANGQYSGPGYWVMTPLALDSGGTVFVNRGFIPQDRRGEFPTTNLPQGHHDLSGLLRRAESAGSFTPEPDYSNGIDWVRNPQRLAAFGTDLPQPILPWFIDLPAGAAGALPQGGETVIEFPNNHLGYAITWFGFAILTPILLAFWLVRQRKDRAAS